MYLDDLGANLKGASAELLACTVCILSVDHTDVGTAPGRDHLLIIDNACLEYTCDETVISSNLFIRKKLHSHLWTQSGQTLQKG